MRQGICCIVLGLQDVKPPRKFQTMTYKKFSSLPRKTALGILSKRILNNMEVTLEAIKFCHSHGYTYRMSSDLFPLITYTKAEVGLDNLPNVWDIKQSMDRIKSFLSVNPVRISMHPSQFNVMSSTNQDALQRTITELNFTGWFLTRIGCSLDYNSPINIHINNSQGDFADIARRFVDNLGLLTEDVRKRLVIENDDKIKCWSVRKLLYHLYPLMQAPITFDYLHHKCHPDDMIEKDAFGLCVETWKTYRPLFHYSESREGKNPRAHSDYVIELPNTYGVEDIDIDFEFKMKDKCFANLPNFIVPSRKGCIPVLV